MRKHVSKDGIVQHPLRRGEVLKTVKFIKIANKNKPNADAHKS